MSKFAIACRGLDCLLALDAEHGYPRWLSTLREGVALPSAPVPVFTLDHAAGTLDIDVIGDGVMRTYADGSVIEGDGRVTKTVPAGTTTIEAFDWGIPTSRLYIRTSTALSDAVIAAKDLPRATREMSLNNFYKMTGTCLDLPRVIYFMYLINLYELTGNIADLPRTTHTAIVDGLSKITGTCSDFPRALVDIRAMHLPGMTGSVADLPNNTGTKYVFNCINVTGALPVVSTNTPIRFYGNSSVTPEEYDQTIQNCVDAGGTGAKTLYISSRRTSASDANKAILISRGWTVNDSNV